ncbi:c-type cytochrome [Bosea sp. TAF32]|uniref:c-type cytochrome n=1 Tax=Bosea sp. TAF32 TaxID=3237482 RepID=UPI003F9226BB
MTIWPSAVLSNKIGVKEGLIMARLRSFAVGAALSIVPASLSAQQVGDAQKGLAFAREACAACHAVERGQPSSPNTKAPPFAAIANTRTTTGMALYAFLQTSHPTMPNLILETDEIANVVAYILSLKSEQ